MYTTSVGLPFLSGLCGFGHWEALVEDQGERRERDNLLIPSL